MSTGWAVRLPRAGAAALGPLRRLAGVNVLEQDDGVWLRGEAAGEGLALALRKLPAAERFTVLHDGQLVPAGGRVPRGHLPAGDWQLLAAWMAPELPPAALPGRPGGRLTVTLVRSTDEREANVLLTTLDEWRDYAADAAEVRLARWTFAVSGAGDALVRGVPLPPLPGERFVECGGVAVPAGWAWSPAVDPAVLAAVFEAAAGDLVLLHPDGGHERVPADAFTRATRSAVRLSAGEPARD